MSESISRRRLLLTLSGAVAGLAAFARAQKTAITVFKDPSCGCCHLWVEHMNASGFACTVFDGDMKPVKARYKVPAALESCHTSSVGGYVIEGHVPASDVKKLLATKPKDIVGLTIPGMPASAPGMDMKPFKPYEVLSFDKTGKTVVFAKHDKA